MVVRVLKVRRDAMVILEPMVFKVLQVQGVRVVTMAKQDHPVLLVILGHQDLPESLLVTMQLL